jgi:sugar (pentulose or hexulose) kinase
MAYVGIDLGSTNIKAALYDDSVKRIAIGSKKVEYIRESRKVEFDAEEYFTMVIGLLNELRSYNIPIREVILTGQAESLILLDENGKPLRNAISWMDERSGKECKELAEIFDEETCYAVTGQRSIIPTWPATKILHLSRHEPEVFAKTRFYLLLKDYIAYRLCGKLVCDKSIATFSFYFDIHKECYWKDMLSACGIREEQLPPLVEPCTRPGKLLPELSLGELFEQAVVNIGTLDHFAGMIGTGNIEPGIISESTGTVLGISTLAKLPLTGYESAALHFGPFPKSYVFLQVAESGGYCLEWFRDGFMKDLSFKEIDTLISQRMYPNKMLFLPYIMGTNAPEFDTNASGVFYGIKADHDKIDFAYAVMEGVSFLLDRNIQALNNNNMTFGRIISTGGGAKSDLWCQLKADITGLVVEIPADNEAACLGAAMIGAVESGDIKDYSLAVTRCVKIEKRFKPKTASRFISKKVGFDVLYEGMMKTATIMD